MGKAKRKTAKRPAAKKKTMAKRKAAPKRKRNAAPKVKMRTLKGSTGWIKGDAFRVVKKRGGGVDILVRRKGSKR